VKSLYYAANKLRGIFDQCSPAVKNTLFRAYCMPMYACQLWSKYTQSSMKSLRAAYNNAYRIMHYMPRNSSVRPHHVSHCVRAFDAGKVFCFSQGWTCNNTGCVMRYCMVTIFCALANDDTAVVRIKCFASPNVGHVQTPFL